MSDPPPPPKVSPDGKYQWDGFRWLPIPQPAPDVSPGKFAWDGTQWVPRPEAVPRQPVSARNLVLVAGVIFGGLILFGVTKAVTQVINPDCTVGYSDSNLNIEVSGQGADAACQQLMKLGPGANPNGSPYGSGRTIQPTGSVICQVPLHGLTYTVRDTGIITLYGDVVCSVLKDQARSTPSS
jgi:hypothetical protein